MKHQPHVSPLRCFSIFLGIGVLISSPWRAQGQIAPKSPQSVGLASATKPPTLRNKHQNVDQLIQQAIEKLDLSGGVIANEGAPSARIARSSEIPPGPAPLLSFRTFDREDRYRLGKLDLVVDDAGH
jgi:hypothetical protein